MTDYNKQTSSDEDLVLEERWRRRMASGQGAAENVAPETARQTSRERTRRMMGPACKRKERRDQSQSSSESRSRSIQRRTREAEPSEEPPKREPPEKDMEEDSIDREQDERNQEKKRRERDEATGGNENEVEHFGEQQQEPEGEPAVNPEEPGPSHARPSLSTREVEEEAKRIMEGAGKETEDLGVRENCTSLGRIRQSAGKGRPAKTGDLYLDQLRRGKEEFLKAARELKILRDAVVPANLSRNRRVEELKALEEFKQTPTATLPSLILEAVNGVDLVAEKSKNLKGEHLGRLKRSAAVTRAVLTLMIQRGKGPEGGIERDVEMEDQRRRIAAQEREIKELREFKARHDQMEEELRNLRHEVEMMRALLKREEIPKEEEDRQGRTTRGKAGANKKRRITSSPEESHSEEECEQVEGGWSMDRMEVDQPTNDDEEEEKRKAEENRLRLLKEIKEQGMPPVVRPSLKGIARIIEPAVPASSKTAVPEVMEAAKESTKDTRREDGLARMLVECVNEKVDKMGEQLLAKIVDMFPQMTIKGKEENKPSVPTPFPNKVPANDGQAEKCKGKKGKGKGKGGEKGAEGRASVPTAAKPASQLQAKPQVPGGNKESRPTSVAPATKSQERRQVPGKVDAVPGISAVSEWTEVVKRKPKTAGKGTKAGPTQGPANGPKGGEMGKKGSGVGSSSSSPPQAGKEEEEEGSAYVGSHVNVPTGDVRGMYERGAPKDRPG